MSRMKIFWHKYIFENILKNKFTVLVLKCLCSIYQLKNSCLKTMMFIERKQTRILQKSKNTNRNMRYTKRINKVTTILMRYNKRLTRSTDPFFKSCCEINDKFNVKKLIILSLVSMHTILNLITKNINSTTPPTHYFHFMQLLYHLCSPNDMKFNNVHVKFHIT